MTQFNRISMRIEPLRQQLLNHPLYGEMRKIEHLRIFMRHHVFAVWDFMALLKSLQQHLTCVRTTWTPAPNRLASRLVNEIVLCEESDEDGKGSYVSHFDMYRQAMRTCAADTSQIDLFIELLMSGVSVERAIQQAGVPISVREFVTNTNMTATSNELCQIAAAFTFGREDLLPDVFSKLVDDVNQVEGGALDDFKYYLHRHIEVDGDSHGPLAKQMIESICDGDRHKWSLVESAAVDSLAARVRLWDGVVEQIRRIGGGPKFAKTLRKRAPLSTTSMTARVER